jgi:hypothetical protein
METTTTSATTATNTNATTATSDSTNEFITSADYEEFKKNDDDLDRCIKAFHTEMPSFLRKIWIHSDCENPIQYEADIKRLEQSTTPLITFNQIINWGWAKGAALMDDMFTFNSEEELNMLSADSYSIIGYFYNIHLR